MTPRERVRAVFPDALAEENGDAVQVVVVGNYAHAFVLGVGRNAKAAWGDALRQIRAAMKQRAFNASQRLRVESTFGVAGSGGGGVARAIGEP